MTEGSQGVMNKMRGWYNWLTTHVLKTIKNSVSNTMKRKIVGLCKGEEDGQWYDARDHFKDNVDLWHDTNPEEKLTPHTGN
jgi:hypothetical protein